MPDVPTSSAPAGWFPDGSGQYRYWDGSVWTEHVAPMHEMPVGAATVVTPAVEASVVVASAQRAEAAVAARAAKRASAAEAAEARAARTAAAAQERADKAAQRVHAAQAKAAAAAEARTAAMAAASAAAAAPRVPATAQAIPVASTYYAPTVTDTRPSSHRSMTWVVASVVALAVLIITALGGFGGMFISLGLVALVTGVYPLVTGRRSWIPALMTRPRSSATAAGAILLLLIGGVSSGAASAPAPQRVAAIVATASPAPSTTPKPSATPIPAVSVVEDVSTKAASDANTLLREAGYVVAYALESGESTAAVDGMTVKSQSPAPGTRADAGSTVTLTLLAPAPAPAPVIEQPVASPPAPAPAAPAPQPAPPAPAPVAPAPAPAPAPQTSFIKPGTYCSPGDVGRVAQADTGKSYKCGGKGPDNSGDYHWNSM
jgi:hypothetical protein